VKITDALKTPAGPAGPVGQGQASNARAAEKTQAPPPASDNVRLSPQAQEIVPRMSTAVFDTGKVDRIRAAIADGQFKVNSEKVADGLLETVRDLLHSRKRPTT
jgi:negative regulator of flagellin synthesis FlgM